MMRVPFRTLTVLIAFTATCHGAETLLEAVEACTTLRRDAERLACYDRAVASGKSGQAATGDTAENMFGATRDTAHGAPGLRDIKREELRQISGTVTSLRRTDDGMIILTLENGQVWRQQDSDIRMMVEKGDQVTIVRAALGTFRIADKSGRYARFKRVR
jgi:hypothetical protein